MQAAELRICLSASKRSLQSFGISQNLPTSCPSLPPLPSAAASLRQWSGLGLGTVIIREAAVLNKSVCYCWCQPHSPRSDAAPNHTCGAPSRIVGRRSIPCWVKARLKSRQRRRKARRKLSPTIRAHLSLSMAGHLPGECLSW